MKRFLIVGCGGSGGVTLQYLMDQLRADLQRVGIEQLPRSWQFVHVDVPLTPDGGGAGHPPVVSEQGGRYVPMSYRGATYANVYSNVSGTVRQARNGLSHLTPWVPPSDCGIPIISGAGQHRGVGRALTLPKIREVTAAIAAAHQELASTEADAQLMRVQTALAPTATRQIDPVPVTLVVSSMAGGAGASMVLDVCRLISGVDVNLAGRTALFVYTPEVFKGLAEVARQGVDANAMAMTGELIAAQLGAAASGDVELLKSLGWSPVSEDTVPFKRIFPVGARIGGDGGAFGDGSLNGIYRATGRGLAALMLSESASNEFVSFDMTNTHNLPTNVEVIGWGAEQDQVQWGSFGFASVGLGRERYSEYAAQRLARVAVDRLAVGHLAVGDQSTGTEQLARRVGFRWPIFRDAVGLPATDTDRDVAAWISEVAPASEVEPAVRAGFDALLGSSLRFSGAMALSQFTQSWRAQAQNRQPQLVQLVEREAYRCVYQWHQRLCHAVEQASRHEAATSGLPTLIDLLKRARAELPQLVNVLRERSQLEKALADPSQPDELSWRNLNGQSTGKAPVHADHVLLAELATGHHRTLLLAVQARAAQLVADVLVSARDDLLVPMAQRCEDVLAELTSARASAATETGMAQTRTDQYAAWPAGGTGEVPRRFSAAHNEVFLTSSAEFETTFQSHLTTDTTYSVQDSLTRAVVDIVVGQWASSGGVSTSTPVVTRRAAWRPGSLPRDPADSNSTAHAPQRADYQLHLRAPDVLARSRAWLGRPEQAFSRFVNQSLYTYLREAGVGDDELGQRSLTLRRSFNQALSLSRPLVAINPSSYLKIHGQSLKEDYKFSELPFRGLGIAAELDADIRTNPLVDDRTADRLTKAVVDGASSPATRIDLFGSYAPAMPLVFSSLLAPMAQRWSGAIQPNARDTFWRWRRARRLAGALPLTKSARLAMIGGFFVGRVTGRLRLPGESFGTAVEIFDADGDRWMSFPDPLLSPTERHLSAQDLLPALLESILVAVARCNSSPELLPLRPYLLLRSLYDDGTTPHVGWDRHQLAAARHLQHWIQRGESTSGLTPAAGRSGSSGDAPAQRKETVQAYLSSVRDATCRDWLAPGVLGAPGGGRYSRLENVEPWTVPLYHEVAEDVVVVLGQLLDLLEGLPTEPDRQTVPARGENIDL